MRHASINCMLRIGVLVLVVVPGGLLLLAVILLARASVRAFEHSSGTRFTRFVNAVANIRFRTVLDDVRSIATGKALT